jgi:hypothetical protein
MPTRRHAASYPRRALAVLIAAAAFAGCTPVMSTPSAAAQGHVVPNEFPLRFDDHSFEAHCYNTIGCKVSYNGKYQLHHDDERVAPPPSGPDYQQGWGGGPELGIDNFPPPAVVWWKSLDGVQHEASVDLGEIFADRKVLHDVPEQDIPEGWAHGISPTIILVVNDRTIEVYMRTHVATRQLQDPANRYSDYRIELVRAWTRTY